MRWVKELRLKETYCLSVPFYEMNTHAPSEHGTQTLDELLQHGDARIGNPST